MRWNMDALITRRSGSSEYNGKFDYSLYDMYGGSILSSLTDINLKDIDTSELRSMGNMFQYCSSLQSLDLSSFNTSNVGSMEAMFQNCKSLRSLDLNNFDTSNVTSMDNMFYRCTSLRSLDLSSFNTSKVNSMEDMFGGGCGLKTLYVRSEADKTKLTASDSWTSLPATCTVIVGKPS